jgi:hypothetical protein
LNLRESYLAMIKAMDGGYGAMCGAMAMSRDALENRIYERKGQGLMVDTALMMQSFSQTTMFAEAIATASGGTFVKLPADIECVNEELGKKWRALYIELGTLTSHFEASTADGVIDDREQKVLDAAEARVHRVLAELLALTRRVYRPNGGVAAPGAAQ